MTAPTSTKLNARYRQERLAELRSERGECLYRGYDVELACALHDLAPQARLVLLPASDGPRCSGSSPPRQPDKLRNKK